jgi:hypothetical protein
MSTLTGYPEINYWQKDYLCDKNKTDISYSNKKRLCNVTFSGSGTTEIDNFYYLFDMDSFGLYDPPAASLYNVTTL